MADFFFLWPNSIRVFRRWMKNALNQDSSYKITGEKKQGMSNFLQSQKLALLPITLPANEGKAYTCRRRTRKTKTEDRKVDIMPIEKNAILILQEGIQKKIQFVRKLIPKMNFAG